MSVDEQVYRTDATQFIFMFAVVVLMRRGGMMLVITLVFAVLMSGILVRNYTCGKGNCLLQETSLGGQRHEDHEKYENGFALW